MNDATLERIETKIAFLERANSDLSEQVFRQHQEIGALSIRLRELTERLHAALSEARQRTPDEERPPHY
jgi:SlyX protein